jgi:hypothetical protein
MALGRRFRLGVGLVVCLAWAERAAAQQHAVPTDHVAGVVLQADEPAVPAKAGKILHAFRVAGPMAPKIDGTLDDEVWTRAQTVGDYVQWDPDNGQSASERTLVQVAYDDRFLYIGIRCFDRTADQISAGLARRDDNPPTDTVSVKFDPRHDHQTGYLFATNPSGLQADSYYYDDDRLDRDFDVVWDVRTSTNQEGWVAEYRIPFSQMRFNASPGPGQIWGFSSRRVIRRRSETSEWVGRPRGERGEVSRWGHLVFDDVLSPPRRLEVQPYALARAEREPTVAGTGYEGSVGADVRIGIGPSATLSATVNPDFGQVEQDPAVLNLSIFETFFPEKRPFFLEDSRTFVPPYTNFQLFHSRRIGRTPGRLAVPAGEAVIFRPVETTVLGAAKLTGKGSGWTYGAMSALTAREYARLRSGGEALIEPLTSYNTVRLQRDVNNGSSNIGAIFTGVFREKDADAFAGGVDYNLRWDRNRVVWNGHWAATRAPGSGGMATSGGGLTNVTVSRKHYGYAAHYDHFGRDFRVNDVGFFRTRTNRHGVNGNVFIEQPDPWKGFRRLQLGVYAAHDWNDQRLRLYRLLDVNGTIMFRNFWNIFTESGREFQAFDDLDTRGGPPILVPGRQFVYVGIGSDSRKSWRINFNLTRRWDDVDGWSNQIGPTVSFQPSGRLQASISTNVNSGRDIAQWIGNADVNGDGVTDHLYGTLRRNVVDLSLRSTLALSRDMTLQVFVQPFVASGDYTDIRRLARPLSFDFDPARLASDPDFNTKSMRSNVVLRWEYLRGSTLYAVWNMSKSDASRPGTFSPLRDLGDTFGGDGPNVFMVKVSYWMSR